LAATQVSIMPMRGLDGPVGAARALLCAVLDAKLERVRSEPFAISSTTVSDAKAALVAPGARYADVAGLLTTTSKPSMSALGMS